MFNTSPPFWSGQSSTPLGPSSTLIDFESTHPFVSYSGGVIWTLDDYYNIGGYGQPIGDKMYVAPNSTSVAVFNIASPATYAFNRVVFWVNSGATLTLYGNNGTQRSVALSTLFPWDLEQSGNIDLLGAPGEYITHFHVSSNPAVGGGWGVDNIELVRA